MLWRTVRGMMNHFKARGQASLERLKVFEGCPHPYDKTKKVVIPLALRQLRLKPGRKYCRLGDFSREVGWNHDGLVKRLEHKRKVKAAAWYQTKKQLTILRRRAADNVDAKHFPERKAAAAAAVAVARAAAAAAKDDKKASKRAGGGTDGKKGGEGGAKKSGDGKKTDGKKAGGDGAAKKAGDAKKGGDHGAHGAHGAHAAKKGGDAAKKGGDGGKKAGDGAKKGGKA